MISESQGYEGSIFMALYCRLGYLKRLLR